ncbi:hypothetical protein KEJ17_04945, partial [Candidatus Bathyarchaeota archaeon]|nr:hypothetical protein [Candidatus Bathyarchaeota archaeon]
MKHGNSLPKIVAVLLIILTFTLSADQLLIKLMFTVSASQTKIDWGNINWVLIDEDEDEQGGENWRDVLAAYITYDESYLYLKLTTVSPPMFPTSPNDRDDDKYRWFIDLDGNMFWQGNVLYEAEYLLSIQDKNNDGVGEIYLLFDSDNDGEFDDELWESIAVNSTDGGFRIIGNHLEVYISWSKIGGMPSTLWLSWCTDRSDNNLNQCPRTDRAETSYGTVIRLGSIRGYKWEDLDGDGVWDNNEPPVTGWEIRLQSDSISLIDYTDINGCYQFLGLPDGSYIVSEAVQNGWIQTYPGNNSYIVQISSGMQFAGKNFGNFKLGVKGGYIWNDTNGNGLWDLDETALSNWEVNLYYLTNGSWEKIKMVYTNSSGFYELTNLEPGDYMVNVTVHSGYILTWPSGGFYSFSVRESGFNEVDNNFGFMKSMASISMIKAANTTFVHVGDTIKYSYKVINTGNAPLTIQYIDDDVIGRLVINEFLKPGEWIENIAIYNVTQNSPDPLMNKAVVYANYTDQQVSACDTLTIDVLNPNIEVSKSGPEYAHEGETITYTIIVKNAGDCILHNVVVKDEILGFEETIEELAKGEERTFIVIYTIPERSDDIINTVKAKGEDALGWEVSNSASWTVDVLHPAIDVIKRANATMIHVGDWIEYNVTVVNIGDCPLYNVNITDSLLGIIWTGDLSVNESRIFNVTYTVMVGDPDPLNNTVTATGVDALGMSVSDEDSCVISVLQAPPQKVVIIFNATGLSSDVSGVVVLSVDEGNYTCGELPRIFEWDVGSKHAFAWISPVNVSDGKRYIWTSTSGLSESQHGEITVPAGGGYVTGNYKIQYLVSFIQEGSAMPVNVEYQIDNGPVVNCTIPFDTWLDSGVKISYNYSSIAYGDAGTRYILTEVDPTSPQIVNAPLTIDGKYKVQYYLEVVSAYGEPCPASGWFDAGTFINASVSSPWPVNAIGTRYVCTGWNGTGSVPPSGTEKSASFTINEPSSIIWNWKIQHY